MAKQSDPEILGPMVLKYLYSMHCRKSKLLICNIFKDRNRYVFSNVELNELTKYCQGAVSFHYAEFKDTRTHNTIKKILDVFNFSQDQPYCVNITKYIALLRKVKFDLSAIAIEESDGVYFVELAPEDKENGKARKIEILAYPLYNYQAIMLMSNFLNYHMEPKKGMLSHSVTEFEQNKDNFELVLDVSKYVDDEGKSIFKKTLFKSYKLNLINGVETVSVKDFVTKNKEDFTHTINTWVQDGHIDYNSVYDDGNVNILSVRPYVKIYVKKK